MKSLDPDLNESYKFIECEQAEEIKADTVCGRTSKEMERRMKTLTDKQLHEKNLVKAE